MKRAALALALCAPCLWTPATAQAAQAAAQVPALPDTQAVARAEAQLIVAADQLALVEREYGRDDDPSELLQLRKRFADGETQYLLGEYQNAAALLYDVVDAPLERGEESRPDALFYLADSLYQQGSWLAARGYFRELAELRGPHLEDALLALIQLSDKVSDQTGIDELYRALAFRAAGKPLKPEVVYVHAKWIARRPDLADADRIARGLAAFAAIPDSSEFAPQARYFEGALLVQRGALDAAAERFAAALQLPTVREAPPVAQAALEVKQRLFGEAAVKAKLSLRAARVRDLAQLALGRIDFEQGKYPGAVLRYQEIGGESDSYPDALFELSACWMKLGEYERALRTTELLLLLVEDSPIAPEARLQQATLELRLKHYARAEDEFEALGALYRPVRESIDALTRRDDPVSYYDDLLQRGDRSLDATLLLPEVARKYVTGRDAGHARLIIDELSASRQGIVESRQLLARLEGAVREGKLDLFPTLQEGSLRAVEVENALLRLEGQLSAQESLLIAQSTPAARAALSAARAHRTALDAAVAQLPDTAARIEERRRKLLAQTAQLSRSVFLLGSSLESSSAQLAAVLAWQQETAGQRDQGAAAEHDFSLQLAGDRAVLVELEAERQELLREIELSRATAPAAVAGGAGEERLRADYLVAVNAESAAAQAAQVNLNPAQRELEASIAAAISRIGELRKRTLAVKAKIRRRASQRLEDLSGKLDVEAEALSGDDVALGGMEGGTRKLLGRIAYQSFARVGRVFYDLVLKADLGVVDTAWTQKRERTDAITRVERAKEQELKSLSDDFSEVRKEIQ